MILFDDDQVTPEKVAAGTKLLTEKIEEGILYDISQWFWVHKRWKHIPSDEQQ